VICDGNKLTNSVFAITSDEQVSSSDHLSNFPRQLFCYAGNMHTQDTHTKYAYTHTVYGTIDFHSRKKKYYGS